MKTNIKLVCYAILYALPFIFLSEPSSAAYGYGYGNYDSGYSGNSFIEIINQYQDIIISIVLGAFSGAFFSEKLRNIRKHLFILSALIIAFVLFSINQLIRDFLIFTIAFIFLYSILSRAKPENSHKTKKKSTIFGSAEWATLEHLQAHNLIGHSLFENKGLFLGDFKDEDSPFTLSYSGDRHLLTVAPTRSGKGVSSIIPNLLSYKGSALVIDPKGENARITAARRGTGDSTRNIPGLGQTVHVVDPWGITGLPVSCFNPLDWLSPDDEDVNENAMMLADSIVTPHGGNSDPFWDEEAKALLMGLILYVALDPNENGQRNLGRVRDIIVSNNKILETILMQMAENTNRIIHSTASRTISKDPKLRSNVLASLQAHTHFLDSPRIRANLSKSNFKFEDLKTAKITIYLVLPADRLETFGRWLRLLVQQALTVNARNIDKKPDEPILFLLDEMAALGRLTMVEQAYGLMAGFGMQLWGIVQDISQLERIYGKGWETFIGNSGVLQYFGSRDQKTAEYFSKLCGVTTVEKFSFSSAIARGLSYARSFVPFGHNTSTNTENESTTDTMSSDLVQRHLAYPDELMVMREGKQILIVENINPIQGKKTQWFNDARFRQYGRSLNND